MPVSLRPHRTLVIALAVTVLTGGPAVAQALSCGNLPPQAAKSVPAPFDAYMHIVCSEPIGQTLQPVPGYRWTAPGGEPIGLVATSAAGGVDAAGHRQFPTSWYAELLPVALSPADQRSLKADFKRAIQPRMLAGATILALRASTSNGERKQIYLVLPRDNTGRIIGLECNGRCFREDTQPLLFAGSPG